MMSGEGSLQKIMGEIFKEFTPEKAEGLRSLFERWLEAKLQQPEQRERHIFPAKMLKDGRITIPIEWRELLNIKEGDIIKIEILEVVRPPSEKKENEKERDLKRSRKGT
jgi:AbrB family looped-hinge helix DNA binding protein